MAFILDHLSGVNAFVLSRVIRPFETCNGSLLLFLGWSRILLVLTFDHSNLNIELEIFFLGKYVLKEEDTKITRGIPQIYIVNRNIKQQMATSYHQTKY